jgi:hypothetical protein
VQGRILEQVSPDAYQFCPNCVVQLSGSGGVFIASGSEFRVANVPAGTYRLDRICGASSVPALAPVDRTLGYAAVTVPTKSFDVLVPKCP